MRARADSLVRSTRRWIHSLGLIKSQRVSWASGWPIFKWICRFFYSKGTKDRNPSYIFSLFSCLFCQREVRAGNKWAGLEERQGSLCMDEGRVSCQDGRLSPLRPWATVGSAPGVSWLSSWAASSLCCLNLPSLQMNTGGHGRAEKRDLWEIQWFCYDSHPTAPTPISWETFPLPPWQHTLSTVTTPVLEGRPHKSTSLDNSSCCQATSFDFQSGSAAWGLLDEGERGAGSIQDLLMPQLTGHMADSELGEGCPWCSQNRGPKSSRGSQLGPPSALAPHQRGRSLCGTEYELCQ